MIDKSVIVCCMFMVLYGSLIVAFIKRVSMNNNLPTRQTVDMQIDNLIGNKQTNDKDRKIYETFTKHPFALCAANLIKTIDASSVSQHDFI